MSGRKIYVGNLKWEVTDDDLKSLFGTVGDVEGCELVREPDGRSKGFGFVTFIAPEDANAAVHLLHDTELKGRKLVVQIAREKPRDRVRRDDADNPRPGARRWA